MSHQQHITITDELLVKFLAGDAGPDEAMAIGEWLEVPANAVAFRQLQDTWEASGPGKPYQAPNVPAEWDRWQQSQQSPHSIRSIWLRWVAAAAVVLLAGSAWLLLREGTLPADDTAVTFESASVIQDHSLPDGSLATLPPNSKILWSQTTEGNRTAILSGNGAFAVKADPEHPFIVYANPLIIRVLGTAFEIKRYRDSITVDVSEGSVMAIGKLDSTMLKAGMHAVYFLATHRFAIAQKLSPGVVPSKTIFEFNDTPLGEAIKIISAAYGVPLALDNPALANCRINTSFNDKPLDYVLTVITESLRLEYRKAHDTVYIYGNACE